MAKDRRFYGTGRRKSSVARVTLVPGKGNITVNVLYVGVKCLPELPVFGLRFVMPTLADKYIYNGLSGETYPDRK